MSNQLIFKKVSKEAFHNVVTYGSLILLAIFLKSYLNLGAILIIPIIIIAAITLFSLIGFLVAFFTSVILIPSALSDLRYGKSTISNELWIWAGLLCRFIEEAVLLYGLYFLYDLF